MSDIKIEDIPFKSDVMPAVLEPNAEIKFSCHKGISCWNECCKSADITLTPYDIVRLKRATGKDSSTTLKDHTVPFTMDADGVPGIKLRTTDEGACLFMDEEAGCTIYENRPTSCRYYPLGNLALKKADQAHENQHFVLVKEAHCKGHEEDKIWTIREWRQDQGVDVCDKMNRGWMELVMRRKSFSFQAQLSEQAKKMFFMASTDLDKFRAFVFESSFLDTYDVDQETLTKIKEDDIALMKFSFRYLASSLFGTEDLKIKEEKIKAKVEEIDKNRAGIEERAQKTYEDLKREWRKMKKARGEEI